MVSGLSDVITCAKFQTENFRGYDFTGGGGEFFIFLLIFAWALQQCSAVALPCDEGRKAYIAACVRRVGLYPAQKLRWYVALQKRNSRELP